MAYVFVYEPKRYWGLDNTIINDFWKKEHGELRIPLIVNHNLRQSDYFLKNISLVPLLSSERGIIFLAVIVNLANLVSSGRTLEGENAYSSAAAVFVSIYSLTTLIPSRFSEGGNLLW